MRIPSSIRYDTCHPELAQILPQRVSGSQNRRQCVGSRFGRPARMPILDGPRQQLTPGNTALQNVTESKAQPSIQT
jgi:hypothetical protein